MHLEHFLEIKKRGESVVDDGVDYKSIPEIKRSAKFVHAKFSYYLALRGSKRFGLINVPTKCRIRLLRDWIIRFCLSTISFFFYDANIYGIYLYYMTS